MPTLEITLPHTIGDSAFLMANNAVLEDTIVSIDMNIISTVNPEDSAVYILETSGRKSAGEFYESKAALLATL